MNSIVQTNLAIAFKYFCLFACFFLVYLQLYVSSSGFDEINFGWKWHGLKAWQIENICTSQGRETNDRLFFRVCGMLNSFDGFSFVRMLLSSWIQAPKKVDHLENVSKAESIWEMHISTQWHSIVKLSPWTTE